MLEPNASFPTPANTATRTSALRGTDAVVIDQMADMGMPQVCSWYLTRAVYLHGVHPRREGEGGGGFYKKPPTYDDKIYIGAYSGPVM